MRHFWSLVAGIAAAPLAWLLLATGQHRAQVTAAAWGATDTFHTAELIGPASVLAAAGVLLGLLGTLRWSPAGPIVAGLMLVLPTVFMFVNPIRTLDTISDPDGWRLLGQDVAPRLPVENGTLLVLGALLLMATFSAQRWRRWPAVPQPAPPATDEQVIAGMAELAASPAMTDDQILAEARGYDEQPDAASAVAEPEPSAVGPDHPSTPPAEESSGEPRPAASRDN